ncbi:methyl-CpG-binding domain-containing protein 2-like isoform X1 [Juglans microcarpa x Juglans regia]|uniref:methyl-CpG-binding domain-containing protein 2-like isoform X1 n=2 Tax=Juglans microcarpa x Juglans regia TaxID=2249226 RepID=UPI001B7F11B8|nr:methyl-CpG-binding domain-containing protein 2-like isoform X1 [Juglans microcarpa x Juglans regia]
MSPSRLSLALSRQRKSPAKEFLSPDSYATLTVRSACFLLFYRSDSLILISMCSTPEKLSLNVGKEEDDFSGTSFLAKRDSNIQEPIGVSSSSSSSSEDGDGQSNENASKQLVLYDPLAYSAGIVPAPDPIQSRPPSLPRYSSPNSSSRVLPSVGAFTVQCARCFKWRLIPTKEKYEAIREHILEQPFYCETAREWRPDVSCDDPADISQDGSRLWAIDKPNIALPPPGWQRLLRIRGEGSTKFADVYYQAPSGKKLRSMVEIQKYLQEHPEYTSDGVSLSQFSFQIPKPLRDDYVRKRPPRLPASRVTGPLEPREASPLALAGPDDCPDLQLTRPGLPPYFEDPVLDPVGRPAKKQARAPRKGEVQ